MASKPKTGEALVKELARKEPNKKCFDCGRGVSTAALQCTATQQRQPSDAATDCCLPVLCLCPPLLSSAVRCGAVDCDCVLRCVAVVLCAGRAPSRTSTSPSTPSSAPPAQGCCQRNQPLHRTALSHCCALSPALHCTDRCAWGGGVACVCRVCAWCACVRRNFNHQVKTINMYTFKPAEVTALEEGGNKKAAKYWLHFYDPENPREYKCDPDDPKSVLEMMKLKYEAKKWCIEQPKKEEPKKEGKKKGKKKAQAGEDDEEGGEHSHREKEGEPSKEKVEHRRADSSSVEALKLKEPAKSGEKGEKSGRSRKSAGGAAAGGEGQPNKGAAAAPAVGGFDFLSSLDNLSFNAPAAPASSGGGGFGTGGFGDDFGGGGFNGGGGGFSSSTGASSGFGGGGGFDAGFDSFGSSAPANGHAAAFSAPPVASAPSSGGGGGGGLAALVEQAQAVKVNPQAVSALVYQIKAIGGQYQLDQQHIQAMVLQAMGKLAAEPPAPAAAKGGKAAGAGGMDAFADLPLPADDGPGAEPDSGNPFGSDDDDDDQPPQRPQQPGGGGGGGFGQQPAFGQQQPGAGGGGGFPGQFGAPQGHFGGAQGAHGGFGGGHMGGQPQQGGGGGGFGAPQGGFGGFGAPAGGGFGAPQMGGGGAGFGQPTGGAFGQPGGGGFGQPPNKANNNALFGEFKPF